jgi:hypothetical protein
LNLSAYGIALIAGGFGIAGTLIGTLLTYWFAQKTVRKAAFDKSFVDACEEFKKRWIPHYLRIKYADKAPDFNNIDWPYETAYDLGRNGKLFVAAEIFQRHLDRRKVDGFRSECNKLFERYKDNGQLVNIEQFSSSSPGNDKIKATKNLLNVIDKILSFAEPKP